MYFFVNGCSLKPLYFVDNLKRDIIYIYFNLEEKTVNISNGQAESEREKDSVSVPLEMQT